MNLRYYLVGCLLFLWACNNIEDAKLAGRNTFIHFYEANHNIKGIAAEATDAGYIVLCNDSLRNGEQNNVIIQTDKNGEKIADDIILPYGYARSLKSTADGYYIIGDSIKRNEQTSNVADQFVYSARLFKLSTTGNVIRKIVMADRKNTSNITDIHGDAVTINANGDVIVLGSFKAVGSTEKPFITSLNSTTLDTIWSMQYNVIERDYVNSKSVHIAPTGNVIWASDLIQGSATLKSSYVIVPYIKENSTFENASQFGETTDQAISISDIQPAASAAFGYGIIGRYTSTTGTNPNLFFIRADQFGNIIKGSERYFDGESLGISNTPVDATQSSSDDSGDAITATSDGGFILGGSMVTTLNRGNGGKDILLIKVDGQGNVLWNKIFGGIGDETLNSIRETADGGLLICGSNNLNELSSAFIMKTDKNGELNN